MNRSLTSNQFLVCLTILIGSCCLNQPLLGQAAFRQALEQLDTNQNGEIEPDEIDDRSRRTIRFIDTNKDGRVSKEELSQISGR